MEALKGIGRMFYMINPAETYVEKLEDIPSPDYVNQATPYFIGFILIEYIIQRMKGKRTLRINDGITSLATGIYLGCGFILVRGIESFFYIKIYENYRIMELPWDSPLTWYIAALGVDFGYYWVHRAAHASSPSGRHLINFYELELNFFWAQHQVHHSSEEYNLTTALRQSFFQGWIAWVFYLPLAFFVPPPIFLIHAQFNLLFQFWIHTELIDSMGPLEYILNTPRHHRIHHGSNRYCLDKNYAGALIIWDRMFGTFQEEKPGEKIVYGLVEDVNSMNPFWLQFFYFPKIYRRMKEYPAWGDKMSVLLKGPGWYPGKPRLGDPMEVPEVPNREMFNPKISIWQNIYAVVHFLIVLAGFDYLAKYDMTFSQLTVWLAVAYIIYSLTSIGLILENRQLGIVSEIGRSIFSILILQLTQWGSTSIGGKLVMIAFGVSAAIWTSQLIYSALIPSRPSKKVD